MLGSVTEVKASAVAIDLQGQMTLSLKRNNTKENAANYGVNNQKEITYSYSVTWARIERIVVAKHISTTFGLLGFA